MPARLARYVHRVDQTGNFQGKASATSNRVRGSGSVEVRSLTVAAPIGLAVVGRDGVLAGPLVERYSDRHLFLVSHYGHGEGALRRVVSQRGGERRS
jgi:hypothetical protein